MDIEEYSKINPASSQDLAGRDYSDLTGNTYFPTKGNYYMFASIFSFVDKNPKDGSEVAIPAMTIPSFTAGKSLKRVIKHIKRKE